MATWKSQPIFVSSTFADMQAERDHLRAVVFPALEERLRARRSHLEWVDLRLGVATASLAEGEARELQVLKVCLAEVRRCRPFLIVLLGGFVVGGSIGSITGALSLFDPLGALVCVLAIELAARVRGRLLAQPLKLRLQVLDMARMGLLYGLLLDGFKLL